MGREAAESLHRPDAAATADAAAILIERSGCARLFPSTRRSGREAPRALIPPPPALSSPPALPPLSAHTPHSPHPAAATSPPSLSSSVRPPRPRSTPSARSPTPPSPDLCQRPEGKREASAAAGGVRVSRRWRRQASGSRLRGVAHGGPFRRLQSPANAVSLAPPCPPPLRSAIFPPGPRSGMGADFSHYPLACAQAFGVWEAGV